MQLCQKHTVPRTLTLNARRILAIASRLDYCNAVLYGATKRRLEMVMNVAARLVTSCGKYEHITPVLHDVLDWLPVPQRCHRLSAGASAHTVYNCICCIQLYSRCLSGKFTTRLHADGASPWPSRSLFCGTWRSGRAENSNGTQQTKFQRCRSGHLEESSGPLALVLNLQRTVSA